MSTAGAYHRIIPQWVAGVNPNHISWAFGMTGGCERWAQMEIAFLRNHAGNNQVSYTANCEVYCYDGTQQRADIVVQSYAGQQRVLSTTDVLELKCWQHNSNTSLDTFFRTNLSDDVAKSYSRLKQNYRTGTTRWVIGLTHVDGIRDAMNNANATPQQARDYLRNTYAAITWMHPVQGPMLENFTHDLVRDQNNQEVLVISYRVHT